MPKPDTTTATSAERSTSVNATEAIGDEHNIPATEQSLFAEIAAYAHDFRASDKPLNPSASPAQLRSSFYRPLPETPQDAQEVLKELIAAAEPGLMGTTKPGFLAWVMGASHPAGVAADWLVSLWGQNAAIYQTAPAAAIAEEAVIGWILDLLNLPSDASVGITTGATMAGFTALAAARDEVLRRAGHDVSQCGLQNAPLINIFISAESHDCNFAALRYLGFGEANLHRIPADANGIMDNAALRTAMQAHPGPAIVIAQAGHIHTGACDHFEEIADLCKTHNAWFHIDGAFGLWARVSPSLQHLAKGAERSDSWSVDGHKFLQIPYECGFAIVRDPQAHRRAMDITAGYLPHTDEDGRNPTHFGPELSRRARGFPLWVVLQTLGRSGVVELVEGHCRSAQHLAGLLKDNPLISIEHKVCLNQVTMTFGTPAFTTGQRNSLTDQICRDLNATDKYVLRKAEWNGRTVLRVSFCGGTPDLTMADQLATDISAALRAHAV